MEEDFKLLTPGQSDSASFSLLAAAFWQRDIITVVAAIPPHPVKGLWLLCWWVIHITEPDAQIPETTFYCCIKAARARGAGPRQSSSERKQMSRELLARFHSRDVKGEVNCYFC